MMLTTLVSALGTLPSALTVLLLLLLLLLMGLLLLRLLREMCLLQFLAWFWCRAFFAALFTRRRPQLRAVRSRSWPDSHLFLRRGEGECAGHPGEHCSLCVHWKLPDHGFPLIHSHHLPQCDQG